MSNDATKNRTVRIFGNEYPIAGVDDPAYMEELARFVDGKMNDIAKESSLLSSGKIAILAALNMADELFRSRKRETLLRQRSSEIIGELNNKIDNYLQK